MFVIGNNKFSICCKSTIHKFIVIGVIVYKIHLKKRFNNNNISCFKKNS